MAKEIDLFAFINHADPTKVRIGERENEVVPNVGNQNNDARDAVNNLIERDAAGDQEIPVDAGVIRIDNVVPATVAEKPKVQKKRRRDKGASGSNHPSKKLRGDHGTSGDVGWYYRCYYYALCHLLRDPTPERRDGGPTDSVSIDDEVTSIVRSSVPPPPLMTTATATIVVVDISSVPIPRASHEPVHASIFADFASAGTVGPDIAGPSQPSALDEPDVCRSLVDQLAPLVFFSQLRSIDYEQLFAEFNVEAARQTCLGAEVRMRLEHELRGRKKFEGKCAMQANLLKEKDARVASLKAQLCLKEAEAIEAIRLRCQVAAFESAVVIKDTKLASSHAQIAKMTQDLLNLQLSYDELSIKATSLESEKDKLIDQVSTLEGTCSGLRDEVSGYKLFKEQTEVVQDEQVKMLSDKVTGIDADLMGMDLHLDKEFYPRFLTTITGQRWILSRGLKLMVMKCLQSPEHLTALGGAIGRAIDKGMQDGLASDFPLLAQLASYKDASMSDLMDLLYLEGPAVESLKANQLKPSPEQLMLPIYLPKDQVVIGETSLSYSLDAIHARVQWIRGDVAAYRLSLYDVMVPLIEPLSDENLTGETSTSRVPTMATATALSTTFIQSSSVPLISMVDYEVSGVEQPTEVPSPPNIVFEKEELETTPKYTTAD
ncbi:hypothetical protein Tco_0562366 [Tanacetum coccineum]